MSEARTVVIRTVNGVAVKHIGEDGTETIMPGSIPANCKRTRHQRKSEVQLLNSASIPIPEENKS